MDKQAEIYTATTLARAAGVSASYIQRLCKSGRITATRAGGIWIIEAQEAARFMGSRKQRASKEQAD